jgi:1-acyl-sn-glycerol-3-phosphate acyltransferase
MIKFMQALVKTTAWPVQFLCFRTKIFYENGKKENRKIKGAAIIASNHTSIWDYAVMIFTFPARILRYLMAEILFERNRLLGWFLRSMGGVRIDRNHFDFSFVVKCEEILEKGGVIGVFPEGRLPEAAEETPLPFKPSMAYIALKSGAPIVPVYVTGSYFNRKRNYVMIGEKINVEEIIDENLSERENIEKISAVVRAKIVELGDEIRRKNEKAKN